MFPTQNNRNLGVTLDGQLSLNVNITATTHPCRCMLHHIRSICLLLTQKAALTLLCSSAPFTGYQWLPTSISKHQYLHLTPQPIHSALHLPSACCSLTASQTLNKITTVCCPGSYMVERAPQWHQDSRKSTHLPPQTKDTSLLTIPWIKKLNSSTLVPLIWHLPIALCSLAFMKKIVLSWFLKFWVCALMVECTYCKSLWIKTSAKWHVM